MGSKRYRNRPTVPSPPAPTLAFISDGTCDFMFTCSLARWLAAAAQRAGEAPNFIALESGPRLARARCDIVAKFLESPDPWLLMVDTDMVFEPQDVDTLLHVADKTARPIVGGLCFTGGIGGDVNPTLYCRPDPTKSFYRHHRYPENALFQVDATGAAFLLVHRTVFETMAETHDGPFPWFADSIIAGRDVSEDITFCQRATDLGYPIFVHTGVQIGHVKRRVVNASAYSNPQS